MTCTDCQGRRDLKAYPWDKCISDQRKRGYSKERAAKICGYIKDKYGSSNDGAPANAHVEAAKALGLEPDEPVATVAMYQGPCVLLDTSANDTAPEDAAAKPRWVQVAYEGHFKGHWMGEFEFTRQTFDQIVKNFHARPEYKAGAEQAPIEDIAAGKYDVVPYDFHHASEQPPTSGDIAAIGAPAQGWAMELAVRNGADGKAQLWAYSRFLEPAATYIANKQYRRTSVAVWFDSPDAVTGEPIGAQLTSIAITNQPFLQGMVDIAATHAARRIAASGYYYGDAAMTAEEAFEAIRRCLCLPETADVSTVAAEVAKLKQWAAPGATPPAGVEVGEQIAKFRAILALPVLSTEDEVFAELDKLFARLSGASTEPAKGATQETDTMTTNATTQGTDLRAQLAQSLAARLKVDATAITDAKLLLQIEQGQDSMENLAALLEGLGASNVREALAKVADAKKIADQFNAMMPEFNKMKEQVDGYEAADAEGDVDMAMASLGFDPKDGAKANLRRTLTKERKADKAGFRKEYGIADQAARQLDAERAHLTQSIATDRQTGLTGPLAGLSISNGRVVLSAASPAATHRDSPKTGAVDVTAFEGANLVQKTETYVRAQADGAALSYADVHKRAVKLTRDKAVFVRD